jgi:hypothetical protein
MLVNTATRRPTISGVTSIVRHPSRSPPPGLPTPNSTQRPVLGSGNLPQLLRNNLRYGSFPSANLIRCCIAVSLTPGRTCTSRYRKASCGLRMQAHLVEINAKVIFRSDLPADELPANIYSQLTEFIHNDDDIIDLDVGVFVLPRWDDATTTQ